MTDLEKLFKVFTDIAKNNSNPPIQIGTYINGGIEANGITIPKEIVLKLDFLTQKRCTNVVIEGTNASSGGESHTHSWSMVDKSEYIEPLKNNDRVAFYRLSPTQYLILGRVE